MKHASIDDAANTAHGQLRMRRSQRGPEKEAADDSVASRNGQVRSSSIAQTPSARYVWYVIALLFVINAFNYMDRMALAVLAPLIKTDLKLSDAQLGLLIGFSFALFYALCGIPIARWADHGIRRNIIAIAVATWSVMTALSGAAQTFWHLLLARVGVGAGEGGSHPVGSSIICDYVPLKQRSGVFAIYTCGLVAGLMLGMVVAGRMGESIGWRWTFVALGLPGIGLAIIVRLTLREPARGRFDAVRDDKPYVSPGGTLGVLWRCRTYRLLVFAHVVSGFVQFGLIQWWPSFYSRVSGLTLSSVGVYLGIALGGGMGIGLLIGGLIANKAAQRDVRLPLLIGALAAIFALPAALGSLFISSAFGSMVLVAVMQMFLAVSGGAHVATLYSVVAARMRATAGAISTFASALLGHGLGPFCVGLVSDILTPLVDGEALRYALLVPIGLIPVWVIGLYAAAKALPTDLRAEVTQVDENSLSAVPIKATVSGCGS